MWSTVAEMRLSSSRRSSEPPQVWSSPSMERGIKAPAARLFRQCTVKSVHSDLVSAFGLRPEQQKPEIPSFLMMRLWVWTLSGHGLHANLKSLIAWNRFGIQVKIWFPLS
ncbi:unnamed protein product [Arabidopsis arenosa]|uniref:Uncharacterized protein n=1 Tax=Arabidopsis arenosa TaxID=38785 RepID=A0A8S2AEG9_ARAAE|nr:unnamed protein product [Arabidopsis arenosa]